MTPERFIQQNPKDPRCEPFHRKDGYSKVSKVLPDPDGDLWLCPSCGKPMAETIGAGPIFDIELGRYVGEDERVCRECSGSV